MSTPASDDYLETTTLRQFLDAGGELVYRPEGNTSTLEDITEQVARIATDVVNAALTLTAMMLGTDPPQYAHAGVLPPRDRIQCNDYSLEAIDAIAALNDRLPAGHAARPGRF